MTDTIQPVEEKAIAKTVTMYPDQWAVVDEIDNRFDFRNVSSALRFIVNDYSRLTRQGKAK